MSLPDENRVSKALQYLADTDEPYARASAALETAEREMKTQREIAFLEADGTQGEKSAKANSSGAVKLAGKKVDEAFYEKELLKARRATAQVLIDVWRSLNSNRRAGMV